MRQYYYVDAGGKQAGPVGKHELKSRNIGRQTMVWCEGMSGWAPAGSVAELNEIFANIPPSPPSPSVPSSYPSAAPTPSPFNQAQPQVQQKPSSYMWLGICTTLLCCLPFGIVSIYYASKVDSSMAQGNYDAAVKNSNNARTWGIVSAAVGFIVCFLAFVVGMAGA